MTPQHIADAYFAAMRLQDVDALLALFAKDGVIIWPDGRQIMGHEEIRTTYDAMFTRPSNNPSPGPLMIGQGCFSSEVHSRLPDGSERRTTNVFMLDGAGLVTRTSSYRQG
jgi:hypothetical protein